MSRSLQRGKTATRLYVKSRRIGRRLRHDRRAHLAAAGAAIFAVAFAVAAWVAAPLVAAQALAAWADAGPGRSASAGRITVNPFTLTVTLHEAALSASSASLRADRAVLDFGMAALFGGTTALDELALEGGRLRVGGARASAEAGDVLDAVPARPFSIAQLAVSGGMIEWVDGAAPLVLDGVSVQARDVDSGADASAPFEVDIRNAIGGVVRIEGELAFGERTAEGRVVFENVAAAPIATRLLPTVSFAGTTSGAADFEWRGDARAVRLRDATLRSTRTDIEWADGSLLAAASLEAAGEAQLDLAAPLSGRVWIDTLALAGPTAVIVLRTAGDDQAGGARESRALDHLLGMLHVPRITADDEPTGGNTPDRSLAIGAGRIELADGVIEIVDAGLPGARPSVGVFDVEGAVERVGDGVTANLAARVGEGTATLDVRTAFGEASALDVTLDLQDIPADVFAEHARRLAGYALEGGVVGATVAYRIDGNGIDGSARIGARGVTFEPIAEPIDGIATRDVELALALLEDPHGAAAASFDFRAPSDAAESARIGELLAAGVVAELRAVAASPFDALGAAAGVEGAALAAVSFSAGGAEPSEQGTLDALAAALHARPRVGLRVPAVAHGVLDRDALAAQQIELHVTLATAGPTLVARPRPVDFGSPRHRDVLDEFAGERLGDERRETIASYFARTPDGRIVESDRTAYYRALFDALVEDESIPQSGLERLGRYRARAIADGLTARGIAAARIELAPAVVLSGDAGARPQAAAPEQSAAEDAQARGAPPTDDGGAQAEVAAPGAAALAPEVDLPLEVLVLRPPSGTAEEPAPAAEP